VLITITALLSLQAYRHCIIFVLVCLGVMIFQLAAFPTMDKDTDKVAAISPHRLFRICSNSPASASWHVPP
jgi:hypothetical protein